MKQIQFIYIWLTLEYCFNSKLSIPLLREDGSPNFAGFCPYQNFCTANASKTITHPEYSSCCQSCSCSTDCHLTGTCCPDMVGIVNKEPRYPCKDLYDLGEERNAVTRSKSGTMFRVIDDCPNEDLGRQFPRCTNMSSLLDFVLVTDSKQIHIYRNADCALCNGVTAVIFWELSIAKCSEIAYLTFSSFNERNEYILENCFLHSRPPSGMEPVSRCYDETVPVFNCSLKLPPSVNVSLLKDLCTRDYSNQKTEFLVESTTVTYVYANIFCYLCQHGIKNVKDICLKDKYTGKKNIRTSFSAILAADTLSPEYTADECPPTTLADPRTEQCRSFFCPLGKIPANRKCLPAFSSTEDAAFRLHFDITWNTTKEQLFLEHFMAEDMPSKIGKEIFRKLDTIINKHNFNCGFCAFSLFQLRNSSNLKLSFEIEFYTSRTCSFDEIVRMARLFVSRGHIYTQVKLNDSTVQVKFFFSTEFAPYEGKTSLFDVFGRNCFPVMTFTTSMLLDCPFFALNLDEFETKTTTTGKIDLVNNIVAHNLSVRYMCVDNYFLLWSSSNTINACFKLSCIGTIVSLFCQIVVFMWK